MALRRLLNLGTWSRLRNFLILSDFINSYADTSLFFYNKDDIIIWIVIYIDDTLIITRNNYKEIESCSEFKCKDLGTLKYFWGMEVIKIFDGSININQSRCALEILSKHDMLNCQPSKSPVLLGFKLSKENRYLLQDVTYYRALVVSLQYISQTRFDLTYSINQVAEFV